MFPKNILIATAFMVLASLACGLSGVDFQAKSLVFDVRLGEEQLNAGEASFNLGEMFSGSYEVDFQPGTVMIRGDLIRPDGEAVRAELDVAVFAQNGELVVQILDVRAEGMEVSDERIQDIQERISKRLSQVFQDQSVIEVESVEITEDEMIFTIKGSLPSDPSPQ